MIKNGLLKRKANSVQYRQENYYQEYLNKILGKNKATRRQGLGSLLGTVASTSVSIEKFGSLKNHDCVIFKKASGANLNNGNYIDSFREALAQLAQLLLELLLE